jgi:membrane fusion protein (multidrug efflux system)
MRAQLRSPLIALVALAAACGGKAKEEDKKEPAAVTATVGEAADTTFAETVEALGAVTARPGHIALLAAPAQTRVAKVFVTVGASVKAGDPLIEFETAPFEAALQSAEATLAASEKAAARATRLADAGVLPRKDAEMAQAELGVAKLNAVTARRSRELSTLRAPINGTVTRMTAVLGSGADPSQPLVEVADPSALDIVLTLSPGDAARARVGQSVTLTSAGDAADTPSAMGRVAEIANAVDSTSGGVAVRVSVTQVARTLRLAETLTGRIAVALHAHAVVVPLDALVPAEEGFKVFVVDSADVAHATEVRIGGRSATGAWITDGLKAGQHIVTKGAYGVDDDAKITSGEKKGDEKDAKGEKADTTQAGPSLRSGRQKARP